MTETLPPDVQACRTAMAAAPSGTSAPPFADALPTAGRNTWDGATVPQENDLNYPGGNYRTLAPDSLGSSHPGCSAAGLLYDPAAIPGFSCAAKEYPFPAGASEDSAKPIVLLFHGNSDAPVSWEAFVHPDPGSLIDFNADTTARDQLAERLPAAGFRTIAGDYRILLIDDPTSNLVTENAALNVDHGWAVPLAQELIKRVIEANPERKVSIVGFSLGSTIMRDAVRRLFIEFREGVWEINIFERLQDMVVAAGAHHGVNGGDALCSANNTMRGTVACELGQRNTYTQTDFHTPLNGPIMPDSGDGEIPGHWYETPCADGDYAYGLREVCGGNAVQYTTITMEDLEGGTQQDAFVSEYSSRLHPVQCATNIINGLNDFDTSGYFLNGLFRNHYGAVRSEAGLAAILSVLSD